MMPALFVAHGSPMVAIEDNQYAKFLKQLGDNLPRPNAIVTFSAHWESPEQMVSDIIEYSTIYDFSGFPEELYQMKYSAKGSREVTDEIMRLLSQNQIPFRLETKRGLDHGVWTILHRMYPGAEIPVVTLSIDPTLSPAEQYRIGKALAPLRERDVLIIGSGVTVHNFQLLSVRHRQEVKTVIFAFENWLEERLNHWDLDALFHYEEQAPYARVAVPVHGEEHLAPLFYAMGAADNHQEAKILHLSLSMEVFTNSVYQFG